jgi:hypothetical protein
VKWWVILLIFLISFGAGAGIMYLFMVHYIAKGMRDV